MADGAGAGLQGRMRDTALRLSGLARELTAEHGLGGYTVEELCERAGVSRRTFFNYFASKEDAVFGRDTRRDEDALDEQFLALTGSAGPCSGETLLADLVSLVVARWNLLDFTAASVSTLTAVFQREPRLFTRLLEMSRAREKAEIELVERREDLTPGDLRAAAAVQIVGTLSRAAAAEFLHPSHSDDFATIMDRRLAAARTLFAPSSAVRHTTHLTPTPERIR